MFVYNSHHDIMIPGTNICIHCHMLDECCIISLPVFHLSYAFDPGTQVWKRCYICKKKILFYGRLEDFLGDSFEDEINFLDLCY